ncbi:glycerate kinase [Streptococcus agalactiae]|nr:glycerate kinase [Streptococcus agalactiae]
MKAADYVFTGEGWIFIKIIGKAPYISRLAFGQEYQKPVFACAGYIGKDV